MYQLLPEMYGEDILPRAYVSEWYKQFLERREELEDDQQPDCSVILKTD
jgi:hypothetical protein